MMNTRRRFTATTRMYGTLKDGCFLFSCEPVVMLNAVFMRIGESSADEVISATNDLKSGGTVVFTGQINTSEVTLSLDDNSDGYIELDPYNITTNHRTNSLLKSLVSLVNCRVEIDEDEDEDSEPTLGDLSDSAISIRKRDFEVILTLVD